MASSDRKSRKMGRKALFELHRNEGKVAADKRREGKTVVRPCRKKRAEKRTAAATIARAAVDVAAHEAAQ
jgi:hypothetical protein